MAMSVRTNVSALMGAGQLNRTQKGLSASLARISTGARINKAADDAAGLGVATNLETTIGSARVGIRNPGRAIAGPIARRANSRIRPGRCRRGGDICAPRAGQRRRTLPAVSDRDDGPPAGHGGRRAR